MSATERPPGPAHRLNPAGTGYARNRSITMAEVMWDDTDEAAERAGVKFSEWGRRLMAKELHAQGFDGYSEDGLTYPADRKPEP